MWVHSSGGGCAGRSEGVPRVLVVALSVLVAGAVVRVNGSPRRGPDDLSDLVSKYREEVSRLPVSIEDRRNFVATRIAPLLARMGEADPHRAVRFFIQEKSAARVQSEIAAECAYAALRTGGPRVADAFFAGFEREPHAVQRRILDGCLGIPLSPAAEKRVLALPLVAREPNVRVALPAVVGQLGSVAAVESLLAGALDRNRLGEEARYAEMEYRDRAVEAIATLGAAPEGDVRRWLEKTAIPKLTRRKEEALEIVLDVGWKLSLGGLHELARELLQSRGTVKHGSHLIARAARVLSCCDLDETGERLVRNATHRIARGSSVEEKVIVCEGLARSDAQWCGDLLVELSSHDLVDTKGAALRGLAWRANHDPRAVEALGRLLCDRHPGLQRLTLRYIADLRSKAVIEILIEALAKENSDSFRGAVLARLISLTGRNLGLEREDWRKWWRSCKDSFEVRREPETNGRTVVRQPGLSYFGVEIASREAAFVVDRSSSMRRSVTIQRRRHVGMREVEERETAPKIDILKEELTRVLQELPSDTDIALVSFFEIVTPWLDEPMRLTDPVRANAEVWVRYLETIRGTNLFGALSSGLTYGLQDVYLLSDGAPTSGTFQAPRAILREVRFLNEIWQARIHCISFGLASELLRDLAARNGATYRVVQVLGEDR